MKFNSAKFKSNILIRSVARWSKLRSIRSLLDLQFRKNICGSLDSSTFTKRRNLHFQIKFLGLLFVCTPRG